ncbi:hypothetical protein JCM17380_53780 [Desulfosporosinus burensis]
MIHKQNKKSKQVAVTTSTHAHKDSPSPQTTGKERDAIIPTKDKSPDDLEILD